ncbi:ABC transporter substrate-binding protein [Piscinibacter gummiphilus]|uniref:ABC transporter substrate-binding protein n=1 Tax=Piscinibacter gummiphilus TaxID=946333 RepID=A0A1W6L4E9_9BURK|nr:ABC transporter substrate-binding protein [Piscinibacter gummiphilus]ARN19082.1 ABC transporter substrate-binding protein [Piscinibacter gummiphilus]ATU63732.1 ABC transporter substrate-binding protein [Piscinibacter gummiphilus]GLS93333.1 ABC transporter substrate-binding protein [Piscinibacter gummiphilus]
MSFKVKCLALALGALSALSVSAQTRISMYYPVSVGGPLTQVVDKLVGEFQQANPDVKVEAIYAGNYDDARMKAMAALKAGTPVQTSVLFSIDLHELKDQGVIRPFDDFVKTAEDKAWLQGFYPALMENGRAEGKTWGIPFQRSTIVMFYNKDAFRQAGLDPEKAPRTWAEMRAAAAKLVRTENGATTRWGMMIPSTGYAYWMFGALAKQNGQLLANPAGTQTRFNQPKTIEALEFWSSLSKDGLSPKGLIEWGTLRQNFVEGKTAMMWHTTGNLTAVLKEAKFDVGVAQLPANTEPGSPTGGGNFYLFKSGSDAEQQAAFRLVKFLTAPERSAEWSVATGYVGVSAASYATPALKKYAETVPQALVARDQLSVATAELSTHQAGRVRKVLDDAIQSVITGQQDAKTALDGAQAQADRVLKPYQR